MDLLSTLAFGTQANQHWRDNSASPDSQAELALRTAYLVMVRGAHAAAGVTVGVAGDGLLARFAADVAANAGLTPDPLVNLYYRCERVLPCDRCPPLPLLPPICY